ncbi:hypothetical protein H257_12836 [Aphanomyces astaci]|uniref:Uncharacterized protein n=1 Tax=Aphanomyces astaci TaxID=112090 RepID=W4FZD4_APHAT|nr:hypothetical protein H257_12836 [Aphanomyces astaci]ETV72033.1 hypothetical protein H257_12836 [Aphanomyces astaci]|eukprot:XP_009838476.1 hypothetical protein H257_12836 [Aphanomyces astaci]
MLAPVSPSDWMPNVVVTGDSHVLASMVLSCLNAVEIKYMAKNEMMPTYGRLNDGAGHASKGF